MATLHQPADYPPALCPVGPRVARIGVTGHRELPNPDAVRRGVTRVLAELDERLSSVNYRYRVLSPLADGADRLVAECVLQYHSGSDLEAMLPMPREAYYQTFIPAKRAESIKEFEALWNQAKRQIVLPEPSSHKEAYENVGGYLVEHCEVLIAVWDGQPERGRGGTACVVQLARDKNRTVFWLDSVTGEIRSRERVDRFAADVAQLKKYNLSPVGADEVSREAEARLLKLEKLAAAAKLDPSVVTPLRKLVLPQYVKAAWLAHKYQKFYFFVTYVAYLLAAAAVVTAALGALVYRSSHWIFLVEVGEISLIMGLTLPHWYRRWQRKWIDHRYLAERLRAAGFLFVVGLDEDISEPPADLQLSWLPDDWVVLAMRAVYDSLRHVSGHSPSHHRPKNEAAVGEFLRLAWIDDQQRYYHQKSKFNRSCHDWLEGSLLCIFAGTILVAFWHFFLATPMAAGWPGIQKWIEHGSEDKLSVVALGLPAIASAIAGISVFRHFYRIAERYEGMSEYLKKISEQIQVPRPAVISATETNLSPLQQLARAADSAMMHEHQSWRAVIGVHLPGPG